MLINGSPLGMVPLASLVDEGGDPPIPVDPPASITWSIRVMLAGEDVTEQLTGQIRIEREEGAAAIAEFAVWLAPAPVDVIAWTGRPVAIYYRELREGMWIEEQRFSGWLEQPSFDPKSRIVSCEATDRLQDLIEAMSVDAIDALVGGMWSADVFDAVEGRSHWDYAQERLASLPASLDRAVDGTLRITPWAASGPVRTFGPGSTVDDSISLEPAKLKDRINTIKLSIDYRFTRLRERHQAWSWEHPDIDGESIDLGFCVWRRNSTELPDVAMVADASSSAGYNVLVGAGFLRVPDTGVYCDPQVGWRNDFPDLVLSAGWVGGMRWTQAVTETYAVNVVAETSVAQAGEVLRRDGTSFESETDRSKDWESAAFTAPVADAAQDALNDWVVNVRDDVRLSASVLCQAAGARVAILSAHRGNRLGWQVPTSHSLALDLVHTLRLEDKGLAEGKLFSIIDEWDFEAQTALTTLTLALSRGGGGVDDPLTLPPAPDTQPAGSPSDAIILPTQLRGRGLMEYDDELDGFSGNYDELDIGSPLEAFPRRLQVTAPEVPAEHRDEITGTTESTFRVRIPDDLLVM